MDIKRTVVTTTLVIATSITPFFAYAGDLTDDIKAGSKDVATGTEDTVITTKVKALFALESDIPSFNIAVTTTDHVVTLDGKVDTQLQANRIIEIAQSVKGVTDVDDTKLTVASSDHFIKDAFITAKVKGRILQLANDNKIAKGYDLHVETTNGEVHIFGKVAKRGDIKSVEEAARGVADVKKVSSNIDVIK
jgi:hyperosmotically inducible protein